LLKFLNQGNPNQKYKRNKKQRRLKSKTLRRKINNNFDEETKIKEKVQKFIRGETMSPKNSQEYFIKSVAEV